ncbi:FkbM family methyltransferase [Chrysiogenes arsenatis]|uniref:FkbM family methyltransferase n=1 Tax=Chrysiogenes arsenatis TaxID=309797 RepID=UPI000400BED6|nr:FkbM family methyltransferase [Chrysiogenes arsenatis]
MQKIPDIDQLPSGKSVAIYGYGGYGKTLEALLVTRRPDIRVSFIIDDQYSTLLEGAPSFCNLATFCHIYNDQSPQILLGVVDQTLVRKLSHNLTQVRLPFTIIEALQRYLPCEHTFDKAFRTAHRDKFQQTRALLFAEPDRQLFDTLVKYRSSDSPVYAQELAPEWVRPWPKQYTDYVNPYTITCAIDGGVFEGNTTNHMIEHLYQRSPLQALYGFEPLIEVYQTSRFRTVLEHMLPLTVCEKALWSSEEILHFKESGTSSRVVSSGITGNVREVSATSLDTYIVQQRIAKVDFLKLDIEGAELMALQGAANMIQQDRPQMAISIYHLKEHLFEIPLYLNSLCSDYIFRLGHYSKIFNETIFYAIPRELYRESYD